MLKNPKIRYNHWLPKLIRASGITLYPFILIRAYKVDVGIVLTHEMIHWGQIQKEGVLKFYFMYNLYWFINIFKYRFNFDMAYRKIPYEVEAYEKTGQN